jgi:hypothetical protein
MSDALLRPKPWYHAVVGSIGLPDKVYSTEMMLIMKFLSCILDKNPE